MSDAKCKKCIRTSQKLFLKGEKCFSAKCAATRKPYHAVKKKGRRNVSEYGTQLKEKQALKFLYGLREKQFVNYVKKATKKGSGDIATRLMQLLELRLDNVIYRLGFTKSRKMARQIVNHGHICVNGRKVSIPSYQARKGDKIAIREQSVSKKVFANLETELKKYNPPAWLKLEKNLKEGQVLNLPETTAGEVGVNLGAIIDFYSR